MEKNQHRYAQRSERSYANVQKPRWPHSEGTMKDWILATAFWRFSREFLNAAAKRQSQRRTCISSEYKLTVCTLASLISYVTCQGEVAFAPSIILGWLHLLHLLYSKCAFFLSRLQWHVLKYLSVLSVVRFMMIKTFCLVCLVVVTLSARAACRIYSRIIPFPVQSAERQRPYLLES